MNKKRLPPTFTFRLEPVERKTIEDLAAAEGISSAAWVRRLINLEIYPSEWIASSITDQELGTRIAKLAEIQLAKSKSIRRRSEALQELTSKLKKENPDAADFAQALVEAAPRMAEIMGPEMAGEAAKLLRGEVDAKDIDLVFKDGSKQNLQELITERDKKALARKRKP